MEITRLLEDIYKKKYRLFIFIGKTHGLNYDAALDAMQTAFVNALQKKQRIQSMSEPELRGYLITIFRNECFNYYRIEKHYVNPSIQEQDESNVNSTLENVADISISPLDKVILTEEKLLRNDAIYKLPEKYREVVQLSLDGFKRKEIAQLLKIDQSNIQNLKHRGLKRYYSIIGKMGN